MEYYKNLLTTHDPNSKVILQSLDLVRRYIIREKLIIVGGMAIDFSLRLKGEKLYEDDELPDYDFVTPHHWIDAYEIAQWLYRTGINDISVINAMHPTTMRVRTHFVAVADVTYVPKNIFENIPTLTYKNIRFVHPHYQYIDQHRSLSLGYENLDMEKPVLVNRWKKDMKRYDLLWSKYPLTWNDAKKNIAIDKENTISYNLIQGQCITGFLALQYWVKFASKSGFRPSINLGDLKINDSGLTYTIPIDSHGITLYSNGISDLYRDIKKKYKIKEERFYEQFLDKLPRKVILDNQWELLDNTNCWIAAHQVDKYHVANLQTIMLYLLVNYIFLNKMKKEDRGYTFYSGYMVCRELLKFGAEHKVHEVLPTAEYYGSNNESEAHWLALLKFNKSTNVPGQPRNLYERDMKYKTVPEQYFKFKPTSHLFTTTGDRCDPFIAPLE